MRSPFGTDVLAKRPTMYSLVDKALAVMSRSVLCRVPAFRRVIRRLSRNPAEVVHFIKFAMVGTLGAIIDFAILNLFILVVGWPKVWSNTISFSVAVMSNFTWNRLWNFPESRQRPLSTQLPQFAMVNVIGLGINQIVFLSLDLLIFTPLFGVLGYNLAKAVAIVIVLFWNYGINRIWTYKGL